ncbi:hypothetical protein ACJX0J_041855, partial [Zea mays]
MATSCKLYELLMIASSDVKFDEPKQEILVVKYFSTNIEGDGEGIALRGYTAVTFDMRDVEGRRGSSDNVAKTTWRDVSYQITKINMYKDGRHVQDMLKMRLRKAALLELTDSLSRTYALGAAGNTTVAIRKGFAIGSGALVSLVLFGAFVSRAGVKSVGSVALKMVEEVRRQFNTILGLMEGTGKPDYATYVKICTDASSIKEMIPRGALNHTRQPPPAPVRMVVASCLEESGPPLLVIASAINIIIVLESNEHIVSGDMTVDAILGPRTIQHETVVSEAAPAAPAINVDACSIHSKAFQD